MGSETNKERGSGRRRQDELPESRARRRLLRMAFYVPPVVLGSIAVTQSSCQAGTCAPTNCNPVTCDPANCSPGTCPPANCNPATRP